MGLRVTEGDELDTDTEDEAEDGFIGQDRDVETNINRMKSGAKQDWNYLKQSVNSASKQQRWEAHTNKNQEELIEDD